MPVVDTLITARWVLPIEPRTGLLEWHSVAVHQGRIVGIAPTDEAMERFQPAVHIERHQHLLLPGLVNAHIDIAQVLLRDLHALDRPRLLEAAADPEFVRTATELAIADAISSGTTCFAGISLAPDVVAATAAAAHMRAAVGLPISAEESLWAADTDMALQKGLQLRDEYRDDPLITTFFAIPDEAQIRADTLDRVRRNADELELPVSLSLDTPRCSPAELEAHGLLTSLLVARSREDLSLTHLHALSNQSAHLLWPQSQSFAQLRAVPVNVALASNSAGERGQLDLLALLRCRQPTHIDAALFEASLRTVTLGGASALGLGEDIGSITAGKWADLCCVDLNRVSTQPVVHPLAQFVQHGSRDAISDVWVAGRALLSDRELTILDLPGLYARAHTQADAFLKH
jgi:5-methylthioadenosine/S-adenosylhomocysteine deaminase